MIKIKKENVKEKGITEYIGTQWIRLWRSGGGGEQVGAM